MNSKIPFRDKVVYIDIYSPLTFYFTTTFIGPKTREIEILVN